MDIVVSAGFVLMGFAAPGLFCLGFYLGFCYSEDIFRDKMLHPEKIPGYKTVSAVGTAIKDTAGKYTETEEQRRQRITAENVENFGTCIKQQEVE